MLALPALLAADQMSREEAFTHFRRLDKREKELKEKHSDQANFWNEKWKKEWNDAVNEVSDEAWPHLNDYEEEKSKANER